MSSSDRPRSGESSPGRAIPISRATFLRAAAAVADGVAFPLLSACSSGGSTGASTGSTTGATLSAAEIATIKKFLGPTDAKYAGVGETWKSEKGENLTRLGKIFYELIVKKIDRWCDFTILFDSSLTRARDCKVETKNLVMRTK